MFPNENRRRLEEKTAPTPTDRAGTPLPELKSRQTLASVPTREIITVVSGLPRSGTSLMMQILEAAGLPLFTDGERAADESNRRGYHEHRRVAALFTSPDRDWLDAARGHAIKVVAPLLGSLPRTLGRDETGESSPASYRVLFMELDMEEILSSQTAFLDRLESGAAAKTDGDITKAYLQQLRSARTWCDHDSVEAMAVPYETLVNRPDEILPRIAAFLGLPEKAESMRACIAPELYRSRRS